MLQSLIRTAPFGSRRLSRRRERFIKAESSTEISPYLAAQRLVRVGEGRTINLICLGSDSPTVVLSAGLGSWSIVCARSSQRLR